MNLSTVPVENPGENLMKSHENVANPAPTAGVGSDQPLSFSDRMHLTAIGIVAAVMVALIVGGWHGLTF